MSNDNDNETNGHFWYVLKKYWKFIAIMIVGGTIAVIGAVLVLLLYIDNSAIGGFGTWSIGEFSIGNIVFWCIMLVIFEILLVGIPALIILGGIALLWWRSLTPEEKADWERDSSSKRDIGGGSGVTFIINIIFLILIWLSGNWNTPLSTIPYSYLIHTYLFVMIILAIPFAIGGLIVFLYALIKE
ncbi:MAG: hypothetical protein ACFFC7_32415 [Candidatus Hermodarchaeota archaeon]